MGDLYYGLNAARVGIPDRLLAHLKVVIATKLRRGESFTFSWQHAPGEPGGRSTIWLEPSIPLRFVFDSDDPEVLNPEVIRDLAAAANSSAGLSVALTEPVPGETVDTPAGGGSAAAAAG